VNCCCQDKSREEIFSQDNIDLGLIKAVLEKYRGDKGNLITVLQEAQEVYGYLPLSVLKHIADVFELKPAQVYGVATFYTQFRLTPVGKYLILLCQGTACHVNGSERIETVLLEELKIKPGETTADGLFTLSNVACLGCCSLAPVMMINGQAYGPLTTDRAVKIIKDLKAREISEGGEPA